MISRVQFAAYLTRTQEVFGTIGHLPDYLLVACMARTTLRPLHEPRMSKHCSFELLSDSIEGMANQVTAHNAGWRSQFRFAGSVFWSGVCEFSR